MSKALFRWLRGELNGYYINNINQSWNEYTFYIHNFFRERSSMQFEHGKIDTKDLQGLGKFAGIFLPRITVTESRASLRLTEGELNAQNEEISERKGSVPNMEAKLETTKTLLREYLTKEMANDFTDISKSKDSKE